MREKETETFFYLNKRNTSICHFRQLEQSSQIKSSSDLGTCPKKYHEDSLKDQYKAEASPRETQEYEMKFLEFLYQIIQDYSEK